MSWSRLLPLLLIGAGCTPEDRTPTWAADPMWITPASDGAIYGFEKWQIYAEPWLEEPEKKHYLCAVVMEIEGTPITPDCEGCPDAWSITTRMSESDCDDKTTANPLFFQLTRLGLGTVDDAIEDEPPYEEALGSWAAYEGEIWESHGWAYPSIAAEGETPTTWEWNTQEPFDLIPAWSWPINSDTP